MLHTGKTPFPCVQHSYSISQAQFSRSCRVLYESVQCCCSCRRGHGPDWKVFLPCFAQAGAADLWEAVLLNLRNEPLLESFGSVQSARDALDKFREKVRAAGFPGLHVNAILWGQPNLPGGKTPADWPNLCRSLALDSVTGYTWVHHGALNYSTFPVSGYVAGRNTYLDFWKKAVTELPVPYFPNVTINWDNSPRAHPDASWDKPAPHVVNPVMTGNTPAAFREACEIVKTACSQVRHIPGL